MTDPPLNLPTAPRPSMPPVEILLVEDDPGDVLMTTEALEESKLLHTLTVLNDGEEAVRYLRQQSPYESVTRPDLVLLDLNLPRLDGREVQSIVKTDPGLRSIPCVVLTTSDAEDDVARSYDLHANAYVTKPVDFNAFTRAVRQIDDFFFTIVRLPQL
jgi:CheY-like chemotaxis protein